MSQKEDTWQHMSQKEDMYQHMSQKGDMCQHFIVTNVVSVTTYNFYSKKTIKLSAYTPTERIYVATDVTL